jgi:hypothetical protein
MHKQNADERNIKLQVFNKWTQVYIDRVYKV